MLKAKLTGKKDLFCRVKELIFFGTLLPFPSLQTPLPKI
jgi:hypothetical protein